MINFRTGLFIGASILSCWAIAQQPESHSDAASPAIETQPTVSHTADPNGCSAKFENFCDTLYSPQNKGNLDIADSASTQVSIRLGYAPNGFTHAFRSYIMAKFAARSRLPADLIGHLEASKYFDKLKAYIETEKNVRKLSKIESIAHNRSSSDISALWNDAIELTVVDRMEKRFPGYNTMDPVPVRTQIEASDTADQLSDEIDRALWEQHPNWLKVQKEFELVRFHYLEYLKANPTLPDATKQKWIERISSVKLKVPLTSKSMRACATTLTNAFYSPIHHTFTVCAGLFNDQPHLYGVIAHELSHAIDPGTEVFNLVRASQASQDLFALEEEICNNAPLKSCPKKWAPLVNSSSYKQLLDSIQDWNPPNPEFYSCLQYKNVIKTPSLGFIGERAQTIAIKKNARLADYGWMVLLTKPELIDSEGRREPNINFLNPCGTEKPKSEEFILEDMQTTLYTAAYLCSAPQLSNADRIRAAGDAAAALQAEALKKVIPLGGRFSTHSTMTDSGFAENIQERFADSIGNAVYARVLESLETADHLNKQNIFFSSNAFFCDPPSLTREYPEETQAQKEFSLEPHSEGFQRRIELISEPIRKALGCSKDFNSKDCQL